MKSHLYTLNNNIKVYLLMISNVQDKLLCERSSLQNQVDSIYSCSKPHSLEKHARVDSHMMPASLVPRMEICRKIPVCCTEVILKVWPLATCHY